MRGIVKRQRADKNGDGKADAGENSDRTQLPPCDPVRDMSKARANRQPGKSYDSQRLSHDQPEQNSPSNSARQQFTPRSSRKRDSSVGKSEQRRSEEHTSELQSLR